MNASHIYKVKHSPKRCDSQLSNASKNAENGPELVEKENDYMQISSIISQKPAIDLWDKYWLHLQGKTFP